MGKKYDVAAYVWPAYTGDEPRTRPFWPEGIGEWQSVKNAVKKQPDHDWPRKPLWGYVNEADPYVMEMELNAAADHGVNVLIYDWYWYDRRPFLEQCLNNGYLKARNNNRVKFYLMWANHSVNNTWDIRNSGDPSNLIWDGAVDEAEFDRICDRLIERYFGLDTYYRIDGKPIFMIYDLANLIRGLGGLERTKACLDRFRAKVRSAGFPGLHLQMTLWSEYVVNLSGVDGTGRKASCELAEHLAFDSVSHYQFVHFTNIDRDYLEILADVKREWERIDQTYPVPYFPHISLGWDNNPRFTAFRPGIVKNNTPENIRRGLEMARAYLDAHPGQVPLLTLNSWNEWTETSYLQPDDLYGYGYLEAVRQVFLDPAD
jgi:hypothetical protein